jgi:uncharacterized membrane protein YphA (DoxX/SURF4 family)
MSPEGHQLSPGEMALLAARFSLGTLFLFAGIRKLLSGNFGPAVEKYRLLPRTFIRPVSVALPVVEVLAGSSLAVGWLTPQTAALIGTLLTLFSTAVAINLVRKRIIPCGCRGGDSRSISWGMVFRNLTLASLAFVLTSWPPGTLSAAGLLGWSGKQGSASDGAAIALTVAITIVCLRLLPEGRSLLRLGHRPHRRPEWRSLMRSHREMDLSHRQPSDAVGVS